MKDISKKLFWQLIVLLIIIRIFSVIFLMFGTPATGCFENHFPSCSGGDEDGYFYVAKSFSEFRAEDSPNFGTIGAALVYVPYIWLTGAEDFTEISKLVFIVQAFIMYSLAIIIVACIGKLIFKNNLLGIITGAIFTIYPYAVYFFKLGEHNENIANFKHLMWTQPVLSDAPSAFFTYLGVFLFLYYLYKQKKDEINKKLFVITGLVCGFASLTRVSNVLICVAIGMVLLWRKNFKEFIVFFVLSFSVFSLQLWFNYANYNNPLHFSKMNTEIIELRLERYKNVHPQDTIAKPGLDPQSYLYFLTVLDKYIPNLGLVLVLMISLFISTIYYIFKKQKEISLFLLFWILFYGLFYGAFAASPRNFRYWLPIVPAMIILFIYFLLMCKDGSTFAYKLIKNKCLS